MSRIVSYFMTDEYIKKKYEYYKRFGIDSDEY